MSSYTKRHSVQDMIRRKMAKNKKVKEKQQGKFDVEAYLETLIEKVNAKLSGSKTEIEKYWIVEDLASTVSKDLQKVDAGVLVSLNWRGEAAEDLVLESIHIEWSAAAQEEKGLPPTTVVDLMSRVFKEMLGG